MPAAGHSDVRDGRAGTPIAIEVVGSSTTSITLTWEPRPDDGPAPAFELFVEGESVGTTTETTFTFTGLSCGTAYELGVESLAAAGDRSRPALVTSASEACPEPAMRPPTAVPTPGERPEPPTEPASPLVPSVARPPAAQEPESPRAPHAPRSGSGDTAWSGAGAFVWHETDVAPEVLGAQLRENGFSWVAVLIHDGLAADPIEGDWVERFRGASQLPIGGWGVLRTEPEREADLAQRLLADYSLDFYIANPEAEYKFSGDDGPSAERYGRSQRFIDGFRARAPDTPAAISSYCRADMQDLDWQAWSRSEFAFLPQAYVNDFGGAASPAACAEGAAEFFPADAVHPTVGVYAGPQDEASPARYAELLDAAGTVGFSVYLAETRMHAEQWRTFGDAIVELAIAQPTASGTPRSIAQVEALEPGDRSARRS